MALAQAKLINKGPKSLTRKLSVVAQPELSSSLKIISLVLFKKALQLFVKTGSYVKIHKLLIWKNMNNILRKIVVSSLAIPIFAACSKTTPLKPVQNKKVEPPPFTCKVIKEYGGQQNSIYYKGLYVATPTITGVTDSCEPLTSSLNQVYANGNGANSGLLTINVHKPSNKLRFSFNSGKTVEVDLNQILKPGNIYPNQSVEGIFDTRSTYASLKVKGLNISYSPPINYRKFRTDFPDSPGRTLVIELQLPAKGLHKKAKVKP